MGVVGLMVIEPEVVGELEGSRSGIGADVTVNADLGAVEIDKVVHKSIFPTGEEFVAFLGNGFLEDADDPAFWIDDGVVCDQAIDCADVGDWSDGGVLKEVCDDADVFGFDAGRICCDGRAKKCGAG